MTLFLGTAWSRNAPHTRKVDTRMVAMMLTPATVYAYTHTPASYRKEPQRPALTGMLCQRQRLTTCCMQRLQQATHPVRSYCCPEGMSR